MKIDISCCPQLQMLLWNRKNIIELHTRIISVRRSRTTEKTLYEKHE